MRPIKLALALIGLGLSGGGCATITSGTTQAINVDSDPQGAECNLMRGGQQLAAVTTPAPVTIKRDPQTIHVRCKKDGFEDSLVVMNSRYETRSAGNILLGGVVGMMVDASSGASSKYDPYVMVQMTALSPADTASIATRPRSTPAPTPVAATAPAVAIMPAAATPIVASTPAAGPFDGTYQADFRIDGLDRFGDTARRIDLKVSAGQGSGTVTQRLCAHPGPVTLAISPSGAVTGELDLLERGNCKLLKGVVTGQAVGGALKLTVTTDSRQPLEVTLTKRDGKSEGAS
jgi:hypothetical protein